MKIFSIPTQISILILGFQLGMKLKLGGEWAFLLIGKYSVSRDGSAWPRAIEGGESWGEGCRGEAIESTSPARWPQATPFALRS